MLSNQYLLGQPYPLCSIYNSNLINPFHQKEDCVAVPTRGIMYVQAVQSDLLKGWNSLQPVQLSDGVSINPGPKLARCLGAPSLHDLQVDELAGKLKLLSAPIEVFRWEILADKGSFENVILYSLQCSGSTRVMDKEM